MNAEEFRVPDGIEPIMGWRGWKLRGGTLTSCAKNDVEWSPRRVVKALCLTDGFHRMRTVTSVMTEAEAIKGGWYEVDSAVALPPGMIKVERMEYLPHSMENCSCGYYATISPAHQVPTYQPDVIGRVYLWGEVVVSEAGWRAEYAYPAELWMVGSVRRASFNKWSISGRRQDPETAYLADVYGVPVHDTDMDVPTLCNHLHEQEVPAEDKERLAKVKRAIGRLPVMPPFSPPPPSQLGWSFAATAMPAPMRIASYHPGWTYV